MALRSPAYPAYGDEPGLKLIEFGGWDMPLCFSAGIIAEHLAVRKSCGLFDVSHMGEIEISGSGAEALIDWLVTNDGRSMQVGQALYSPMCYEHGGVVDDLIVYKLHADRYLLVVNAANTKKDLAWIRQAACSRASASEGSTVTIVDRSAETALLALQGPRAAALLAPLASTEAATIGTYRFADEVELCGARALISRTGYTGEDGFELMFPAGEAARIWRELLARGAGEGLLPCGLGARDTLRIEARLPLYGQELSETISPLEAGLASFVKLGKREFCGREALVRQSEEGPKRQLRGCEMIDKGVPRHGFPVYAGGEQIGEVTSGERSPLTGAFIGLVLVERGRTEMGSEIEIAFGERLRRARIVRTPFYRRQGGRA